MHSIFVVAVVGDKVKRAGKSFSCSASSASFLPLTSRQAHAPLARCMRSQNVAEDVEHALGAVLSKDASWRSLCH